MALKSNLVRRERGRKAIEETRCTCGPPPPPSVFGVCLSVVGWRMVFLFPSRNPRIRGCDLRGRKGARPSSSAAPARGEEKFHMMDLDRVDFSAGCGRGRPDHTARDSSSLQRIKIWRRGSRTS